MSTREIAIVTAGRSDFGIYEPIFDALELHRRVRVRLIVTGMHLSRRYGGTVRGIYRSRHSIFRRIPSLVDTNGPEKVGYSIARGVSGFTRLFERYRPDMLVVLGDRFEMYAAALAALPFSLPVAHIHGGEITAGAIDDVFRWGISRISHLHFVSCEAYARNLIRSGEEAWRVKVVGAPGLDRLFRVPPIPRADVLSELGLQAERLTALVTFHPVTRELDHTDRYVRNLLTALRRSDVQCVFTYPNADPTSHGIIRQIEAYCMARPATARCVVSVGTETFAHLLRSVDVMVGNSSSGIIEAASFELPVVNIGTRQGGRIRAGNVLDCGYTIGNILQTLRRALIPAFRRNLSGLRNPYGDGHAADLIAKCLVRHPIDARLLRKRVMPSA